MSGGKASEYVADLKKKGRYLQVRIKYTVFSMESMGTFGLLWTESGRF